MALLVHTPEILTAKILSKPKRNPRNHKSLSLSDNGERIRLRVNARTSVKDCEVRIRGLDQNVKLYGQFATPVKQEKEQAKEGEERQNYYVNMGYAIRALREDFPELFYRELSFDTYRDDIVFKDPFNTFAGIEHYKSIFWALRFHGRLFFKSLGVDIMSVWQPVENVIMVRWTVHGILRVPWESRARFDATSEYKLDRDGKIFQHRINNVARNSPSKFQVLSVEELLQSIGCPSTLKPTFFEVTT